MPARPAWADLRPAVRVPTGAPVFDDPRLNLSYVPVQAELSQPGLAVTGRLPPELTGALLRTGPNPVRRDNRQWLFGHGMVHGVELREGRAAWYRNRWVRSRWFEHPRSQPFGLRGRDLRWGPANTHLVCHAGKLMALAEVSYPYLLDSQLQTMGWHDFDGQLRTAMTAHPKICPHTSELHFFGVDMFRPRLTYHVADAKGNLVRSVELRLPNPPRLVHDFAITRRYAVFVVPPMVLSYRRLLGGHLPYQWSDHHPAQIAILPRDGVAADCRWFEIDPCFVFHLVNAHEDGDAVVLDAARYPSLLRTPRIDANATLHRWRVDLATGRVSDWQLDDRSVEFPRIDERWSGASNRHAWVVEVNFTADGVVSTPRLLGYELRTGRSWCYELPPGQLPSEPVFVPGGPGEAEGWVLAFAYDFATDTSDLVVFDATAPSAPVARVHLPQRVPTGLHGIWVPADDLDNLGA